MLPLAYDFSHSLETPVIVFITVIAINKIKTESNISSNGNNIFIIEFTIGLSPNILLPDGFNRELNSGSKIATCKLSRTDVKIVKTKNVAKTSLCGFMKNKMVLSMDFIDRI
jgi:hypothetical protein